MINKNILEVCLSPDLGGLELYMGRCSQALAHSFNTSCVIAVNSKLKEYVQDLQTFELNRKSSFSFLIAIKLAKIIDQNKIDIVHLHWTKDIPIVVLAKLFSQRKPKVVQTRHMMMTRFKSDFYHKFLYRNIDCIIAVTKEVKNQLERFIPQKIRPQIEQIYLGVDIPNQFTENEITSLKQELQCENSFVIGMVGRINEAKGQYLLIEAIKKLKSKSLDLKVFFVGHAMDESYLEGLNNKIVEYSLEDSIQFLGFVKQPQKFMQMCDVMIMASKNETFGLVTIEAMAMGTCVIGSNSGGVLEIIKDEVDGLLFEQSNDNSLATKIQMLYNDRNLLQSLSKNAQNKAKECFDSLKHFNNLENLLKKL